MFPFSLPFIVWRALLPTYTHIFNCSACWVVKLQVRIPIVVWIGGIPTTVLFYSITYRGTHGCQFTFQSPKFCDSELVVFVDHSQQTNYWGVALLERFHNQYREQSMLSYGCLTIRKSNCLLWYVDWIGTIEAQLGRQLQYYVNNIYGWRRHRPGKKELLHFEKRIMPSD